MGVSEHVGNGCVWFSRYQELKGIHSSQGMNMYEDMPLAQQISMEVGSKLVWYSLIIR